MEEYFTRRRGRGSSQDCSQESSEGGAGWYPQPVAASASDVLFLVIKSHLPLFILSPWRWHVWENKF